VVTHSDERIDRMEASTGALFMIGGALLGLARFAGTRIANRWKNDDRKPADRMPSAPSTTTTPPRISDRKR
jgi:hypothetical protein